MYVFLEALYFRMSYCPHLHGLYSIHASALCSQVPPKGTWKHEALAWVGYSLWRCGNNLPCEVYYSEFLDFFSILERTLSESWMALRWVCDIDHFCTEAPWV